MRGGSARTAATARPQEREGPHRPGLADPDAFAREAHRERARAQRTGADFVVVSMRLVSRSRNPTAAQQRDLALLLALAVAARVRASDFVGWRTDPEELGLILPDTSAEGAAALIQSIERRLAPRLAAAPELGPLAPELVCEVFHSSHPLGADPHAQFL